MWWARKISTSTNGVTSNVGGRPPLKKLSKERS